MNQLYYGDNLQVLRKHIASESVDLIYLERPFNSKRDYNLLSSHRKGSERSANGLGSTLRIWRSPLIEIWPISVCKASSELLDADVDWNEFRGSRLLDPVARVRVADDLP